MSNGLSQAEIDALLQSDPNASEAENKAEPKKKGKAKGEKPDAAPQAAEGAAPADREADRVLSPQETDAMGEIGNISMGTSATTLSTMISRRVNITTPQVSVKTMREIAEMHPVPFAAVQVEYTKGLEGTNILFLKVEDVKIITDLLMGGDGSNTDTELTDMHLSAISEVMNQMVGSASTSMAKLTNIPVIDISPPVAYAVNLAEDISAVPFNDLDKPLVRTVFRMEVEGLIESEIMQVMPMDFARTMVEGLLKGGAIAAAETNQITTEEAISQAKGPPPKKPAPAAAKAAAAQPKPAVSGPQRAVEVSPAQFDVFSQGDGQAQGLGENIDILMDVPLQVSVELGKSKKYIKEILDFNLGSIIVLDKMAGDMVDVVVNGKLIAKAEVVVIDDYYGARITDIVTPAKRLNTL